MKGKIRDLLTASLGISMSLFIESSCTCELDTEDIMMPIAS